MSENPSPNPEAYRFRGLHPRVFLGTASDRYAGWLGQIYSERFRQRIASRQKSVAGKSFREDILPVESVEEYLTKKERGSQEDFSAALREFFRKLPPDPRYHAEVRTEAFLTASYFKVLEDFGIGQVLSHWTWLPSLWVQFRKGGERFLNRGGRFVIRLMTPRGKRYEEAYATAHPFDREIEGMTSPGMVEDTARIMLTAVHREVEAVVVINNRAGGNAPALAQRVSRRFVDLVEGKGSPA